MMEKNVTFVTFEAVFCQKSRKARIAADLSLLGGIRKQINDHCHQAEGVLLL